MTVKCRIWSLLNNSKLASQLSLSWGPILLKLKLKQPQYHNKIGCTETEARHFRRRVNPMKKNSFSKTEFVQNKLFLAALCQLGSQLIQYDLI